MLVLDKSYEEIYNVLFSAKEIVARFLKKAKQKTN